MKKRVLLILMAVILALMGHSPPAQAIISEPNPEGLRTGDRVYMQMSPVSPPGLSNNYDFKGIWDVRTNNIPLGKSLYLMQPAGKYYGINLFHPDTIDSWITAFNGSPDFVNTQLPNIHNWMYYQGTGYLRIYCRDLAELCGMHYYDNVHWDLENVDIVPTSYPSAAITVPANINPGGKIDWSINGQSFVKSIYPQNENKIKYTLTVTGTTITNDTLAAKTFAKAGTYTVPSNAAAGSKITFIISVQDGVGRIISIGKQVEVVKGKVTPDPPVPPPPPPPVPPEPPDYEPEADFDISNSSPVEGEKIKLTDASTHPGAANGEKIVSYEWTIQNLSGATTKDTTAKWDVVGTYSITLRVEDQDGDSDKCTKKVVVGPALPAAVISLSDDSIILGREVHIDGDDSAAAMGRSIKWDEMDWRFYGPDGTLKHTSSERYPLGKGTSLEKDLTNGVINQTGNWTIKLKVKDSNDNVSEETVRILTVYPDQPPIADFWLVSEALRNSYQGYELTVKDQSKPASPDWTLGNEICQRTWILYYDANNDGDFTDSGIDETINAGDTGKAATLSQGSTNDTKPVIRFAKTGRYKLELSVRESADIWGVITPGLSADTSGKTLADKQVMVINLAPTVDFSIKEKVPVDVQFAVDYTVSDTKYNSLQSAQAGFVGDLEAASIDPVTGVQKVCSQLTAAATSNTAVSLKYDYGYIIPGTKLGVIQSDFALYGTHYLVNLKTGDMTYLPTGQYDWSTDSRQRSDGSYIIFNVEHGYHGTINNVYSGDPITGEITEITANLNTVVSANYPSGYNSYYATLATDGIYIVYRKYDSTARTTHFQAIKLDYEFNVVGTAPETYITDKIDDFYGFCQDFGTTGRMLVRLCGSGGSQAYYKNWAISSTSIVQVDDSYYNANANWLYDRDKLPSYATGTISIQKSGDIEEYYWQPAGTSTNILMYRIRTGNKGKDISRPIDTSALADWDVPSSAYLTSQLHWEPDGAGAVLFNPSTATAAIKYYNHQGTQIWQKTAADYGLKSTVTIGTDSNAYIWTYPFFTQDSLDDDTAILYGENTDGTGPCVVLINSQTGDMIQKLSGQFYGADENTLVLANSSGKLTIYGYSQLGALNDFIKSYPWDSNKYNFIVSVIDSDSYEDYTAHRDSLISSLKGDHLVLTVISPAGKIQAQTLYMAFSAEGGWWISTSDDMTVPLDKLAQEIIDLVEDERGADNVVLVDEPVDLISNYQDSENDPANTMFWEFTHDPNMLGTYTTSNPMGLSSLNDAILTNPPDSFDKAGTYTVKCKAQDDPITNTEYMGDAQAGRKWSSDAGYLTIIAHRRPVASFTCTFNTTINGSGFTVTDSSYDPDLVDTDPDGQKGIRTWEWQYRLLPDGDWYTSSTAPNSFPSAGYFVIRLRVQDVHGAWSNWCEQYTYVENQLPVALFEAQPNPVSIDNNCTLIDHSYDYEGDDIIAWEWTIQDIGTRTYTNGNSFDVSWPAAGDYTVTLKVQEESGSWSEPYSLVVKVIDNHKPVAVLTLPEEGYAGEIFMSDGTGSYDPDPGDYINLAYWQYKKPGGSWSGVYTAHSGDTNFLRFYSTPAENELGTWTIRLSVVDSNGLESDAVEKTIEIKEGFEVGGYVTPDPGERGRKMRVTAYAYRKGNPGAKIQIDSMTAYIVHPTKPDGTTALPNRQDPIVADMAFDAATNTYKYTFLVPDRVQANRWPDDGDYYIRIAGQKNTTVKEALIPCKIKGHILNRIYIKTRSW